MRRKDGVTPESDFLGLAVVDIALVLGSPAHPFFLTPPTTIKTEPVQSPSCPPPLATSHTTLAAPSSRWTGCEIHPFLLSLLSFLPLTHPPVHVRKFIDTTQNRVTSAVLLILLFWGSCAWSIARRTKDRYACPTADLVLRPPLPLDTEKSRQPPPADR